MAANLNKRNYKMSDADLIGQASKVSAALNMFLEDLENYGVTSESIAELDLLKDNFLNFMPDVDYQSNLINATQKKNALRTRILETVRIMAMRVKIKWGGDSGNYKRLELKNPTLLSDDLLLVTSRSIHAKMTDYLPDLSSVGLTQEMLNEIESLNTQFELALNAKSEAIVQRDEKTLERIALGNELYEMILKYCTIGKAVFYETNAARYKAFVIYHTSGKKSKAAEKIENEVPHI